MILHCKEDLPSLLRQSTSESDEHGQRLKCNLDEQMHETDPISSTITTKPLSLKQVGVG